MRAPDAPSHLMCAQDTSVHKVWKLIHLYGLHNPLHPVVLDAIPSRMRKTGNAGTRQQATGLGFLPITGPQLYSMAQQAAHPDAPQSQVPLVQLLRKGALDQADHCKCDVPS